MRAAEFKVRRAKKCIDEDFSYFALRSSHFLRSTRNREVLRWHPKQWKKRPCEEAVPLTARSMQPHSFLSAVLSRSSSNRLIETLELRQTSLLPPICWSNLKELGFDHPSFIFPDNCPKLLSRTWQTPGPPRLLEILPLSRFPTSQQVVCGTFRRVAALIERSVRIPMMASSLATRFLADTIAFAARAGCGRNPS